MIQHEKVPEKAILKGIFERQLTVAEMAKALSANKRKAHMEKIALAPFYIFAKQLCWIEEIEEGDTYEKWEGHFERAYGYLDEIDTVLQYSFKIAHPDAQKLFDLLEPSYSTAYHSKVNNETDKMCFDIDDLSQLQSAYSKFETVLLAELNSLHTYILASPGIYSIDVLLDGEDIFIDGRKNFIPMQCEYDFRDAGKTLALKLPLATSFHLFRSIEAILMQYGEQLGLLISALKPAERNWGKYLSKIEETVDCDKIILAILTQIKDDYRNPLVHPDVSISYDEVYSLFALTHSLILRLMDLIAKLELKKEQASLPTS